MLELSGSFFDFNSQFSESVFEVSVREEGVQETLNQHKCQTIVQGLTLKHAKKPE